MARHASAVKAARQAIKHRERNRQARSKCKNVVRELKTALEAKAGTKTPVELKKLLNDAQKTLMTAAGKNIMSRKTASRYVARLSTRVARAQASA